MSDSNRRNFLKNGATAALGVGALGALSGGLAVGCDVEEIGDESQAAKGGNGGGGGGPDCTLYTLNQTKYDHLAQDPAVLAEFITALDQVVAGLISDPAAYIMFLEGADPTTSLATWDRDHDLLDALVIRTDPSTQSGRLKRILTVAELYDQVPGLDEDYVYGECSSSGSSSSGPIGDCETNQATSNGCCVIHTWGWGIKEGLCTPAI